jgi:hypothetical protein
MTKIRFTAGASKPAPGPTQPPIQWVAGGLYLGVKGRGVKLTIPLHLVPMLRIREVITTSPIRLHGVVLN